LIIIFFFTNHIYAYSQYEYENELYECIKSEFSNNELDLEKGLNKFEKQLIELGYLSDSTNVYRLLQIQANCDIPLIIKTHHAAQRLLKNRVIVNPFAHLLDFPAKLIRSRRDHERFIDLIAVITFLRQFQKEEKEQAQSNGEKVYYIESDLTDYDTAYSIMKQILPATLINFPKSAQRLYEIFRRVIKDRALNTNLKVMEVKLTQRELRELTGLSHDSIKRNLRILVEYEYIKAFGKVRGSKKTYSLVKDEKLIFINLSGIATPLQIEERLKSGASGVVE